MRKRERAYLSIDGLQNVWHVLFVIWHTIFHDGLFDSLDMVLERDRCTCRERERGRVGDR